MTALLNESRTGVNNKHENLMCHLKLPKLDNKIVIFFRSICFAVQLNRQSIRYFSKVLSVNLIFDAFLPIWEFFRNLQWRLPVIFEPAVGHGNAVRSAYSRKKANWPSTYCSEGAPRKPQLDQQPTETTVEDVRRSPTAQCQHACESTESRSTSRRRTQLESRTSGRQTSNWRRWGSQVSYSSDPKSRLLEKICTNSNFNSETQFVRSRINRE